MPAKIRLARHGKKGKPFYHVVVADSRAPRDGKFIEKIGSYNPNTNPATIELDVEKAVSWLHKGAQPTDTTRAILSYKGALYKKHLDGGVKKGVLTQDQADAKYATWLDEKATRLASHQGSLTAKEAAADKARHAAEAKVAAAKAAAIVAKNTPPPVEEPVAEITEETATTEETTETPAAESNETQEPTAEA